MEVPVDVPVSVQSCGEVGEEIDPSFGRIRRTQHLVHGLGGNVSSDEGGGVQDASAARFAALQPHRGIQSMASKLPQVAAFTIDPRRCEESVP